MRLLDITTRLLPPAPWAEGDNIPWSDPEFSKRMLAEHLNQEHNLASRSFQIIDRQVQWIHHYVLHETPTRILDLACGPGLYTQRLARLGHHCVGIDYAPAAIRCAQEAAAQEGLDCTYRLGDVRSTEYSTGYDLVMMLYGQLNVFRRREAQAILAASWSALLPGGLLLLEPQRFTTVEQTGRSGSSWYSCAAEGGLFSPRPHLCLCESAWDARRCAATQRFFIVDAETGQVTRHALTTEAYTADQYQDMLGHAGFSDLRFLPSLLGMEVDEESQAANLVILARKGKQPVPDSGGCVHRKDCR